MKRHLILALSSLFALSGFSQHTLTTKKGEVLDVKITEICDTTILYQNKGDKKAPIRTIAFSDVECYKLKDGIVRHIPTAKRDTIVSLLIDEESSELLQQYAENQNKAIGKALKTTGIVSMAVGVPCVAAGIASLLYAELLPNPTSGYTTSQTLAKQDATMEYMNASEYISKLQGYNVKVHAAQNAGYLLSGAGAALTIVGIPLYCYGKHLMTLNVTYTGNGAGISLNF